MVAIFWPCLRSKPGGDDVAEDGRTEGFGERLRWVNAGHPSPLLLRAGHVVAELDSPTTLPVGFGGDTPIVTEGTPRRGDRVLFYTDWLVEEHIQGGAEFGDTRMREVIERVEATVSPSRSRCAGCRAC
jgi:serine phosphatase RsbU (regulator of sigma subunit)